MTVRYELDEDDVLEILAKELKCEQSQIQIKYIDGVFGFGNNETHRTTINVTANIDTREFI